MSYLVDKMAVTTLQKSTVEYMASKQVDPIRITNDVDVLPLLEDLKSALQEHFIIFTLDSANYLIKKHILFIGTVNKVNVSPLDVFSAALEDRATSIILVHNHCSVDPAPGSDDISVTDRLRECGKLLGIAVIDHIIVSRTGSFSFKNKGLFWSNSLYKITLPAHMLSSFGG